MKTSTLIMTILLFSAPGFARETLTTLTIPGTGACQELLAELAGDFNRLHLSSEVIVPASVGSTAGILAVINNQAVMARVARPLSEDEARLDLQYTVFGRDAVVFAVGANVTVHNLSSDQLAGIFSGRIVNWREVGGDDARIRVLVREPRDASLGVIRKHIESFQSIEFPPHSKTLYQDSQMIAMLQKYKSSIGFLTSSTLSTAEEAVHSLSIDNVAPTPENVLAGRYKLLVDFAMVYRESALNDLARDFLGYLSSERGMEILYKKGIIPTGGG